MPKILIKRGTATQWTNSTTALLAGELGLDTTNNIIKVGDGSTLWNSLSGLTLTSAQVSELAQDALSTAFSNGTHSNITVTYNDNANSISLATGPDVVTTTSLNNTLTNPTSGYVSIGDVGVADGVASLGPDGKIPDSEIPSEITRNTAVQTLTNKTIGLGTGITSAAGYDNISGFFGQSNIAIYQAGIDKGGRLNISSGGVITVANSGIGYTSGIVTTSGGTRFIITVGGNALSGTLAEFNAALTDGDFATESYVNTAVSNLVDAAPTTLNTLNELATALGNDANFSTTIATSLGNKLDSSTAASTYLTQSNASSTYAPKASPTFTGTVNGITASMVGLGNVDNTSDANKPISTATQTALNSKLDSSGFTYASIIIPVYTAVGDLPSAASNHGRWAHVHGAGAMYFAHGGSWYRALDEEDEKNIYLTDSGTARTLGSGDAYKIIEFTNSNTIVVTIPNDASDTTFPIGSYVEVRQMGGGQITVSATSPATLVATDNQYKTRVQYSAIVLEKRASNAWYLAGDTTA
jgi:hypothetical protein